MKKTVISECGKYRYTLHRQITQLVRQVRPMLFIMLNPSTADADKDDPTIRRCIKFADRELCTSLTVVNLYAFRATNPKELLYVNDPIGPENDSYLCDQIQEHRLNGIIIAAWGANPLVQNRGFSLNHHEGPFQCLGETKHGYPRHPLYVKSNQKLEQWK